MKTNKKGFTLIELLAVIVILGIILLIATPIILDVISDARKSSAEKSAAMFLRTAQQEKVTSDLSSNSMPETIIVETGSTSVSAGVVEAYEVGMSEQPETYCLEFDPATLEADGVIEYKLGTTTYFFSVTDGVIADIADQSAYDTAYSTCVTP